MASKLKQIFVSNYCHVGHFIDLSAARYLSEISTIDGLHKLVTLNSDVNFDRRQNLAENSKIIKPVAYLSLSYLKLCSNC